MQRKNKLSFALKTLFILFALLVLLPACNNHLQNSVPAVPASSDEDPSAHSQQTFAQIFSDAEFDEWLNNSVSAYPTAIHYDTETLKAMTPENLLHSILNDRKSIIDQFAFDDPLYFIEMRSYINPGFYQAILSGVCAQVLLDIYVNEDYAAIPMYQELEVAFLSHLSLVMAHKGFLAQLSAAELQLLADIAYDRGDRYLYFRALSQLGAEIPYDVREKDAHQFTIFLNHEEQGTCNRYVREAGIAALAAAGRTADPKVAEKMSEDFFAYYQDLPAGSNILFIYAYSLVQNRELNDASAVLTSMSLGRGHKLVCASLECSAPFDWYRTHENVLKPRKAVYGEDYIILGQPEKSSAPFDAWFRAIADDWQSVYHDMDLYGDSLSAAPMMLSLRSIADFDLIIFLGSSSDITGYGGWYAFLYAEDSIKQLIVIQPDYYVNLTVWHHPYAVLREIGVVRLRELYEASITE